MSYSEDELGDGDGEPEEPTDEEAIYSPERQVRHPCDDRELKLECCTSFTFNSLHNNKVSVTVLLLLACHGACFPFFTANYFCVQQQELFVVGNISILSGL